MSRWPFRAPASYSLAPPARVTGARIASAFTRLASLCASLALPAMLAACGASETVTPATPTFEQDIIAYLQDKSGDDVSPKRLMVGYIDLDKDGGDEAFVLWFNEDNCTETACHGWIFAQPSVLPATARKAKDEDAEEQDGEDRPRVVAIGRFDSFTLPVASRERSTHGWRDVIVNDPRTGREDRLRFDGTTYR